MRLLFGVALVFVSCSAAAAPIQEGLTVTEFFTRLEQLARDLAEGGMELNRVHCVEDGALCQAFYGAATSVAARGPSQTGGMESITVTQELAGETNDFWLTSALVFEVLEPDFLTIPEQSELILDAMRGPSGGGFTGDIGKYVFDRLEGNLSTMTVTAK